MQTRPKRFLVTGASGWVGETLVRTLLKAYPDRKVLAWGANAPTHAAEAEREKSLADMPGVEWVRQDILSLTPDTIQERFAAVFHLAAFTATESPGDQMRINDQGTRCLIEALGQRLRGVPLIFTGSIAGVDQFAPPATGVPEHAPLCARTEYGQSKAEAERILQENEATFGYRLHIVRIGNVAGPGGYRPGGLFDVIQRSTLFARIPWPGAISIIHVQDLAEILHRLQDVEAGILNVAHPDPMTVRAMINLVHDIRPLSLGIGWTRGLAIRLERLLRGRLKTTAWRWAHLCGSSMCLDTRRLQEIFPNYAFRSPVESVQGCFAAHVEEETGT